MKITESLGCKEISGSTEISYTVEEAAKIKQDIKEHLDPIIALVFWVSREGLCGNAHAISMMWAVVQNIAKESEV